MKGTNQNQISPGRQDWFYSEIVKDHFSIRGIFYGWRAEEGEWDGHASRFGGLRRHDVYVDSKSIPKTERIQDLKWRTFGCALGHCFNLDDVGKSSCVRAA